MRVQGFCTMCSRVKRVTVRGNNLVMLAARGGAPRGICDDCMYPEKRCRFCQQTIVHNGPYHWLHKDTNHAWCKFRTHAGAPKDMPYPLPRNEVATP